ncbi:MAG: hypothetical protein DI586_01525 [Micavibrio aeruginosavorus]|uniref:Uncharacterized protein n=1 Tax=Micavibrio aeruginosavorus TaxID=349221 RepID=A0A2W5HN25_9BACT|nr:MAG: hypothetical protein DI586_01525 [Micavibrio aeruginosavorus]
MKNQGFIKNSAHSSTSGNVMVIILIMIALLAAVTITITRMGDNTAEVSQEEASVIASQVLRQAKTMANGVDGLMGRGCSLNQLSFENSTVTGYLNVMSPSDKSCWLFDASGAGLSFPIPPKSSNDGSNWIYAINNSVGGVGKERETGDLTASNSADLIMFLRFTNNSVCKAINLQSGIATSFQTAPPKLKNPLDLQRKFSMANNWDGYNNYSSGSVVGSVLFVDVYPFGTSPVYDKKTGCVEISGYNDESGNAQNPTSAYFFYQVLVER